MSALRANPHFASLFAHVHPLCWPILWWSLNRLIRWYVHSGYEEILYATTPWGYVYIAYCGDRKPDPSAYRPYVREKPRWDDPVWSTHVPVSFLKRTTGETLRFIPNPPLRSGGGGSALCALTEGACALTPNTS